MNKPGGNPVDAVAGLMQERQRYEAWLAALEAKRSVTPPHVFERVKADYETRLRAVYEQLMGRSAELQETLNVFTARLSRVQQEEAAKRDARYEAELRADVGEVGQGEWIEMQRKYDEEMGRLGRERETIAVEVARLHQILAMTEGQGREGRGTPSAGASTNGPSPGGSGHPPAPLAPGTRGAPRPGSFDELAFLKSVVEPVDASGRRPAPTRSGGGRSSGAAPARSPTPADNSTADADRTPGDPDAVADVTKEPDPVPEFLKDVPSEQAKTLKCVECGSMNFPTEWYCERCGAELAAM